MATETKSHAGNVPITVDEYSDLKQSLKSSEMRMQQLLQSNTRLGEEVALLQNMASCYAVEFSSNCLVIECER